MYRTLCFIAAMFVALPAAAETVCNDRSKVKGYLEKKFSEAPVAMGLASNGGVVEVFTAHDGKTWTITITMPNGKSCFVAAGEGWEAIQRLALEPQA